MSYRLGKLAAREDPRTLRLTDVLARKLPSLPAAYDCDAVCPFPVPAPMFANDRWGDCVIAGRAHQTLRFEGYEQGRLLPIQDKDVLVEYWREQGCLLRRLDRGLVVLDSLKHWRRRGWRVGRESYRIYAFARVHPADAYEVRAAIYLLNGAGAGLQLPISAQGREVWDAAEGEGSGRGSWGGHYIYLAGYNEVGPVCITWGARQQMTWCFLARYADELYAVVDAPNNKESILDIPKLEGYLRALED